MIILEENENKYCLINLLTFMEKEENYEQVIRNINSSAHIVLCGDDNKQFIGFMPYNPKTETKGEDVNIDKELLYRVYPFVFIHDENSKMFIDPITNSSYTYSGLKKERIFNPNSDSLGDYIIEVSNISDEVIKFYLNNNKTIPIIDYKKSLEELESVVLSAYLKNQDRNRK